MKNMKLSLIENLNNMSNSSLNKKHCGICKRYFLPTRKGNIKCLDCQINPYRMKILKQK